MAKIRQVIAHDPARLLEEAAEGFLSHPPATPDDPFPTPPHLLVLRQGRLRDDLLALAATRGVRGWFDPPLCIINELPAWLGSTGRTPCGEFERLVLLERVLRQGAGTVFGRIRRPAAYLEALDQLFGELVAEDVTPDDFEAALEHAHAPPGSFEATRNAELARIYRLYREELDRAGRRDGRDTVVDCARAIRENPDALAQRLRGRREIRILGLQDLRGGWRALLRALAQSPALDGVAIYTSVHLDLDAEVVRLDEPDSLAARLFGEPAPERLAAPEVTVMAAPDTERELEEVALRIRELAEAGTPLHRIAVVARQARPHVDYAVRTLERFGVPATARHRTAFTEVPVIRAILSLFAAAAEGWSRHGLVELAEQPYLGAQLDARILNYVGYRKRIVGLDAWARALDELVEATERQDAPDRAEERPSRLPPAWRAHAARKAFADFRRRVAGIQGRRTLIEWLDWLSGFLERDPWQIQTRIYDVPPDRLHLARLDHAGWRGLGRIVAEWRDAAQRWGTGGESLDVAGFETRLREMLEGYVPLWTETGRGVQVLEAHAAAYRSFDHVFLVGLEAGNFPLHPPRSPILDEADREALARAGLPLDRRHDWERRERELFRVLVAGARVRLTLSHARLDPAGYPTVRSAFVEAMGDVASLQSLEIPTSRMLTPRLPLCRADRIEHAGIAAQIERERQSGRPSRYNGLIEDPELLAWLAHEFGDDRLWSPSQLEDYAKCPWAFFSGRLLAIEKLEEPDEDLDPALRGSILHDALRRFYESAKQRTGRPVLLTASDREWAEPLLLDALDRAIEQAESARWLGHPALRDARRQELRRLLQRYLAFEIEHNEKLSNNRSKNAGMVRTGVADHELAFDDVVLEIDGVRFRFRGFIDRVEVGVDERVPSANFVAAVDYKTTRSSTPGAGEKTAWDDGVVLQVPLYAYALTHVRPGSVVSRVEYRAIKQACTVHSLELYRVDRKAGAAVPNVEAQEKMERALAAVAQHVRGARQGRFPAAPAPSCGCPPFCHAIDICRISGGPRRKGSA